MRKSTIKRKGKAMQKHRLEVADGELESVDGSTAVKITKKTRRKTTKSSKKKMSSACRCSFNSIMDDDDIEVGDIDDDSLYAAADARCTRKKTAFKKTQMKGTHNKAGQDITVD